MATLAALRMLRFIVTVQISSRQHDKPVTKTFSIGFGEWELVCEPTLPPLPAPSAEAITEPLYVKASQPQWRDIEDGVYLIVFTVVIVNLTADKTIGVSSAWLCTRLSDVGSVTPAVKAARDRELEAIDALGGRRLVAGTIQPHDYIGGTFTKELRIAAGDPKPRCTFVVMDTTGNTYTAPVADRADDDRGA